MNSVFLPQIVPYPSNFELKAKFIQAVVEGRHNEVVGTAQKVLSLPLYDEERQFLFISFLPSYQILCEKTLRIVDANHEEKLNCLTAFQTREYVKANKLVTELLKLKLTDDEITLLNYIKSQTDKLKLLETCDKDYEAAEKAFGEGLYKFAQMKINEILKIIPSHAKTLALVGSYYDLALNNFKNQKIDEKELFEIVEWILKCNPNDTKAKQLVDRFYDSAMQHFNDGNTEQALTTLAWMLKCVPNNEKAKGLENLIKSFQKGESENFINRTLSSFDSTEEKS